MTTILVTGGAGFIGSCFVRRAVTAGGCHVIVLDKLTYAGHCESLPLTGRECCELIHGCIADKSLVQDLLKVYRPASIVNFAAESHVDRSIDGPAAFLESNVLGVVNLLCAANDHFQSLPASERERFRFLQISTDEVYGSAEDGSQFIESTPYAPNSPYAASKASADMFVRAFSQTHGLPTLITRCCNNYGPRQCPEKLIPLMTLNALGGKTLPLYGDGQHLREWIYVEDHCAALELVLKSGRPRETYNIGGEGWRSNLEVVRAICALIDEFGAVTSEGAAERLITFVDDRPGHDRRYSLDDVKIRAELGWTPTVDFEQGLRRTVKWYMENQHWVNSVTAGRYDRRRLGLACRTGELASAPSCAGDV